MEVATLDKATGLRDFYLALKNADQYDKAWGLIIEKIK